MNSNNIYHLHCFPAVISHCDWLYYRFSLSFRDIELMMAEKGIVTTYESIRYWCLKFGREFSRKLRARHTGYGDQWFLDEVFCKINGQKVYLWRVVDQDGQTIVKPCTQLFPSAIHTRNKGENNRAENSHQAISMRKHKLGLDYFYLYSLT